MFLVGISLVLVEVKYSVSKQRRLTRCLYTACRQGPPTTYELFAFFPIWAYTLAYRQLLFFFISLLWRSIFMGRQSFRQSARSKPAKQDSDNTEHLDANAYPKSLLHESMSQAEFEGQRTQTQIAQQVMAEWQEVKTNPTQQTLETAKEVAFMNAQAQADYKKTYTPDSSQLRKRTKQDNRRNNDVVRRLAQRPGR